MSQLFSGGLALKRHHVSLLALILAGFALRLYKLGEQSLWYDETVSAFLASQSPAGLIGHTARDIHPPGYYLLLHYWAGLAGESEFALAFFSLLFGLLLIPLTFRLGHILLGRPAATWAALLVALSPYHIWYSQEVRMYTLGAGLGLVATLCGLQALRSRRWVYWGGYIIAAALGLYTLYYFVFLLIILNLFFLFYLLRPKLQASALKSFLVSNLILLCLYLPWLPLAWKQATIPPVPPWRSPTHPWTMLIESWSALSFGHSIDPAIIWPGLLLSLLLVILGSRAIAVRTGDIAGTDDPVEILRTRSPQDRRSADWNPHSGPARLLLLLGYTFGPLLLIALISYLTPLYHVRYLFTYSPAFYLLLGAGLAWSVPRSRLGGTLAALILLAGGAWSLYQMHFDPLYRADDYRAAVRFIEERWQPGDIILANAGYTYPAFVYYTNLPGLERRRLVPYPAPAEPSRPLLLQTGTVDGSSQLGWGDPRADFYAMSAPDTTAALERLSTDFPRLWLLRAYDTVTDPEGLIRNWLAENAIPLEDQPFSGGSNIRVQGFLLSTPPPPAEPPVPFTGGLALAGWQFPVQNWHAGETLRLKFWWLATEPPQADYKLSLKLWTPEGQLAAQGRDEWPAGTLYRATAWPLAQPIYHSTHLTLPPDLPPGQYWLNAELYHPDTLQPLPRQDNGNPFVTLGPITVEVGE